MEAFDMGCSPSPELRFTCPINPLQCMPMRLPRDVFAGVAQLVEHELPKLGVASSSLVARSTLFMPPGIPAGIPGAFPPSQVSTPAAYLRHSFYALETHGETQPVEKA